MVAVQLHGTHTDLKNIIQQSGMKLNMAEMHPGEPNDETFVKQVTASKIKHYLVRPYYIIICNRIYSCGFKYWSFLNIGEISY